MIKQYLEKYQIFVKNIALMDEIFHKEFKNLDDQIEQSKPFSSTLRGPRRAIPASAARAFSPEPFSPL